MYTYRANDMFAKAPGVNKMNLRRDPKVTYLSAGAIPYQSGYAPFRTGLPIADPLRGLGREGGTFNDRIKALWDSITKLQTTITTKPTVELPEATKKVIEEAVGTAKAAVVQSAPVSVPLLVIGGLAIGAWLLFGQKKKQA